MILCTILAWRFVSALEASQKYELANSSSNENKPNRLDSVNNDLEETPLMGKNKKDNSISVRAQ